MSIAWDEIELDVIRQTVETYSEHVPAKLAELELVRSSTIPKVLEARKRDDKPYLDKDELLKLVEWKLKHGTFRPNLMKLISSNTSDTIHDTTAKAYATYTIQNISGSLHVLTSLSGIGPATASLVLSVFDPTHAPFFSDELFRYLHAESSADGNLRGWDRKISYTKKEYDEVCSRVRQMQKRLRPAGMTEGEAITAFDLEKLAYVLARSSTGTSSKEKPSREMAEKPKSALMKKAGLGDKKRKIEDNQPMEGKITPPQSRYPSRKRGKA